MCSKNAYLVLENGTVFSGKSMGIEGKTIGEVVFQTAMVGYQETLTDPANAGLIVAQTFPLIGNYGVNKYCNETQKTHLNGYIVREVCDEPSNFRCEGTLDGFLKQNNVVGICDIDTRKLTRIIREKGVMKGMITTADISNLDAIVSEIKAYKQKSTLADVSVKQNLIFKSENQMHNVAVLDLGVKGSLIEALNNRGCTVTVVPYNTGDLSQFDGVVISDGAGNPSDYTESISVVKALMDTNKPVLGIGLGHTIMAVAKGATASKMHYGHRGANQPVFNKANHKTYITSQNHGYIVDEASLDSAICEASFINANDKSVEGIRYNNNTAFSVQFTPDTKISMVSTSFIYDEFVALLK